MDIDAFAARFESYVLFSAGDKAVGGMLTGIEAEREKRLSRLFSSRTQGTYLNNNDTNLVYIGIELAGRLRVQVGDELAFVGGAFAFYFHIHPLVFSGFEEQFKQYGLAVSTIPTSFVPLTIARDMTIMFILSVISTLYPIFRINRYSPVEAIRHV